MIERCGSCDRRTVVDSPLLVSFCINTKAEPLGLLHPEEKELLRLLLLLSKLLARPGTRRRGEGVSNKVLFPCHSYSIDVSDELYYLASVSSSLLPLSNLSQGRASGSSVPRRRRVAIAVCRYLLSMRLDRPGTSWTSRGVSTTFTRSCSPITLVTLMY